MENRTINLALVTEVAKALQELNDEMVFVGGATYIQMTQQLEKSGLLETLT